MSRRDFDRAELPIDQRCFLSFPVWEVDDHALECELPKDHDGPHQISGTLPAFKQQEEQRYLFQWWEPK